MCVIDQQNLQLTFHYLLHQCLYAINDPQVSELQQVLPFGMLLVAKEDALNEDRELTRHESVRDALCTTFMKYWGRTTSIIVCTITLLV